MIALELTSEEAAAVSIALVGLIHEQQNPTGHQAKWQADASVVARRLEVLRNQGENQ